MTKLINLDYLIFNIILSLKYHISMTLGLKNTH